MEKARVPTYIQNRTHDESMMKVWCELYHKRQKYKGDSEKLGRQGYSLRVKRTYHVARYALTDKQHADVQIR